MNDRNDGPPAHHHSQLAAWTLLYAWRELGGPGRFYFAADLATHLGYSRSRMSRLLGGQTPWTLDDSYRAALRIGLTARGWWGALSETSRHSEAGAHLKQAARAGAAVAHSLPGMPRPRTPVHYVANDDDDLVAVGRED